MRDIGTMGGSTWGLYISNFIFFIAISHAGIAISAAVRIARLKQYTPITRMAELLTIFGLLMAMLMIISDMGRPDRLFNIIWYYPQRVGQSPLVWDITAVFAYFTLSFIYLYSTLRADLALCLQKSSISGIRKKLYTLLIPFYKAGEEEKIGKVAFWMAVTIIPIMVFVHSTVSWIFGLMGPQPGWFSTIFAPYFVVGAIANGIATVIILAIISRKFFGWSSIIKDDIIRGMSNMLGIVIIIYLYFWLSEVLTISFASPSAESAVITQLFFSLGAYSWSFWFVLFSLFTSFVYLLVQALNRKFFNITLIFVITLIVNIALWMKRVILIIPSLLVGKAGLLPYPIGTYTPTWVEWTLVAVTFIIPILLYLVYIKLLPLIPIVELQEVTIND
jgi:Ni/Fe-hydrogenase subunit HybB-like protein